MKKNTFPIRGFMQFQKIIYLMEAKIINLYVQYKKIEKKQA